MVLPQTESIAEDISGIDTMSDDVVLARLLAGQKAAVDAVGAATVAIAAGAGLMADTLRDGGRLVYAAAGSSGLMAIADGLELGGTFGIPPDRILLLMAGGLPVDSAMPGHTEDDVAAAERAAAGVRPTDVVIALSASGNTPYPCTISRLAREKGARTIGIANVAGALLFSTSDVAIHLPTPPEVIGGSTRLGAATAQKAALNMMSTLMGIKSGHVHDGMMVNLKADNAKLRRRAANMVAAIAGVDGARARDCLHLCDGAVKPAVLLAAGLEDPADAQAVLAKTDGNLRAALAACGFYK